MTKTQYKSYIDRWKLVNNHDNRKKRINKYDEYLYDTSINNLKITRNEAIGMGYKPFGTYCLIRKGTGIGRTNGWIKPEHYILNNLLRNKPLDNGFNPKKYNPVENDELFNFKAALRRLINCVKIAKKYVANEKVIADRNIWNILKYGIRYKPNWQDKQMFKFLELFANTVTPDMLAEIDLVKLDKPLLFDKIW